MTAVAFAAVAFAAVAFAAVAFAAVAFAAVAFAAVAFAEGTVQALVMTACKVSVALLPFLKSIHYFPLNVLLPELLFQLLP